MKTRNYKPDAEVLLLISEAFNRAFYGKDRKDKFLTIAWNRGEKQTVIIDHIAYDFPPNTILTPDGHLVVYFWRCI